MNSDYRHRPAVDWTPRQTQRCETCGGLITADPGDAGQVKAAVVAHRATLLHQAMLAKQSTD